MKLDDIARMAISEVSAELEKIEALQNKKQEELERENLRTRASDKCAKRARDKGSANFAKEQGDK